MEIISETKKTLKSSVPMQDKNSFKIKISLQKNKKNLSKPYPLQSILLVSIFAEIEKLKFTLEFQEDNFNFKIWDSFCLELNFFRKA